MTVKLVGHDDATAASYIGKDRFDLYKFTASVTGICTEVRIKCAGSGNIKVAVYADNAGEPGARLAKKDAATAVSLGWNTITLEASCSIVKGNAYWLAYCPDSNQGGYVIEAGVFRYKTVTYSTFTFPDPAGSGFDSATTINGLIAGWGIAGYDETAKLQVVLAAQGKTDTQTMVETARLQVVLAAQGKTDTQAMAETTNKLQVVLAAQGKTDTQAMVETAKLQVVLVAQGEADGFPYLELGKEQVVLAVLGEADGLAFIETGKLQVALAVLGEADIQAMVETARLQVALAVLSEADIQAMLETARLQVVLAAQGEVEHLTLGELARQQVILAVLGEADQYGFIETGRLQVILAQIGISTVWNLQKARLQGAVRNLPSARELEAL